MSEAPGTRRRLTLWTITSAGLNDFGREFRDVIEPGIAGTTNSPRSVTWWAVPRIPAHYGSDGTVDLGVISRHSRIRALSPARHLRFAQLPRFLPLEHALVLYAHHLVIYARV